MALEASLKASLKYLKKEVFELRLQLLVVLQCNDMQWFTPIFSAVGAVCQVGFSSHAASVFARGFILFKRVFLNFDQKEDFSCKT